MDIEHSQHDYQDAAEAVVRQAAQQTASPESVFQDALDRHYADPAVLLDDEVIEALKTIRAKDQLAYERLLLKAPRGYKTKLEKLTAPERDAIDQSNADVLVALARKYCILGHDADGRGIAVAEEGDVRMCWTTDSSGFADWLRAKYFEQTQAGVSEQTLATAVSTLAAIGKYKGEELQVHLRCAKYQGAYYVDLCDDKWRVIMIGATGWNIVNKPPVLFVRTQNMRALPIPATKGDLAKLWRYMNVPEKDRVQVLSWLLESYRPDTPYPILEIVGEQGSAKSSNQRRLRDLIDPNKVALRGRPKAVEDIYVAAANSYVVSFENLSHLTSEQQDAFCTLATGGGFATRQFYTNGEEHVLECKRPVMLNGINTVASQPDAIERTVSIEAPVIPPDQRQDELELEAGWQQDHSVIFAGVLDLFSAALAILPDVQLDQKYRMADFQKLGEAVARALEHPAGYFSEIYGGTVSDGVDRSLETYGVSNALQVFMADQKGGQWEGTVLALKAGLECQPGVDRSNWPKSPRGLAGQLKRIAPGLRRRGIMIQYLGHSRAGSQLRINFSQGEQGE